MQRSRPRRLVTILAAVAVLSVPIAAFATHVFDDVDDGSVHAPGIHYVADTGITLGCDANNYCPGDTLTRAQMGTFLYRSSGNDPATPPSVNAASIASIAQVSDSNTIAGSAVNTASVSCPEGTVVTGGGASTNNQGTWRMAVSRPLANGAGWTATYVEREGNLANGTVTVWALCIAVG
ncbi:S-layer homology domain-containing protein [Nitriliruptor alkaliphilus]|uniref:S-layer homology domain-containing protein n=1 Tax=Nitriliruptor alkaliphilus TaxID=427918 RepID=UPI000697EEE0|nr:S-layer homology domain-containing protein [Nitriliruptor alkaliphilus]